MQLHLHNIPNATAFPGIDPVDGWSLLHVDELDGDGFVTSAYFAARDGRVVELDTCRFRFTPSQARFTFFVENNFPTRARRHEWLGGQPSGRGGWDDFEVEAALERGRRVAA